MSTQNEVGYISTQRVGETIPQFRRVKLDASGNWLMADAADGDLWSGVIQHDAASGDLATVRLRNTPGTFFVQASDANISRGVAASTGAIYPGDDGTVVGATAATRLKLVALETPASGQIFEVGPVG